MSTPATRRAAIIRDHFRVGLSYTALAQKYGMTRSAISGLIYRARQKDASLPPADPMFDKRSSL